MINVAVMAVAFYAVLAYIDWQTLPARSAAVGGAGHRSAHAQGVRADRRRADAGHRDRALLLDVLEPVPLGRR